MISHRALKIAAVVAFFILAVASAVTAKKEIIMARQAPLWRVEDLLAQDAEQFSAYSIRADYLAIDACLRMTNTVESLLLPSAERAKRARHCQALTENLLRKSPQNAYGWYAVARFAQISRQPDEMNHALEQSYFAGPNEQWIAEQRVELAESMLVALSEAAKTGHQNDLAMLVQSKRGIQAIALQYVNNPGFRDRIAAIVEALPAEDQRRFLRVLRREVQSN